MLSVCLSVRLPVCVRVSPCLCFYLYLPHDGLLYLSLAMNLPF